MIGAKVGDRVAALGAGGGTLAAEIALVTGLNGRTLVVDPDAAAAQRIETAAAKTGALVEFDKAPLTMLPLDPGSFDIVVLNMPLGAAGEGQRPTICAEAHRVLRAGGRVVALERGPRPGLLGFLPRPTSPMLGQETVVGLLTAAGFRGVRVLAESEGVTYYEGRA